MASCKDCICEKVCRYNDGVNEYCKGNCPYFKDRSKFIELPCIAMVEQFINNGKFDKRRTTNNGKMAVVYIDKKKSAYPLIDITSQHYNTSEACERIKKLTQRKPNRL